VKTVCGVVLIAGGGTAFDVLLGEDVEVGDAVGVGVGVGVAVWIGTGVGVAVLLPA